MAKRGQRVRTRKPRPSRRSVRLQVAAAVLAASGGLCGGLAQASFGEHISVTAGGPAGCVVLRVSAR
jgi:hypothetical protein